MLQYFMWPDRLVFLNLHNFNFVIIIILGLVTGWAITLAIDTDKAFFTRWIKIFFIWLIAELSAMLFLSEKINVPVFIYNIIIRYTPMLTFALVISVLIWLYIRKKKNK